MSHIRYIPATALATREAFGSFLRDGTVAPYVSEEITRERWVWFGEENLAPEHWRELADNCVPLGRCLDIATLFLAGKGIEFVDKEGEVIEEAQARFQEWVSETTEEEFLNRTFSDVALLNAFTWDITPLGNQSHRVGRVRHRDAMRFRVGKPDDEGVISQYWYCTDWTLYKRRKRYAPKPLEIFDPNKLQAIATLYAKTYKQGRDFYGEPWWLPATEDAEVWCKVPKYNRTQMDTGFSPVVHLHLETERDEADIDKMYDAINESYMGATGQGLFLTFGRKGEEVKLTPLQRGDHAGELDAMRDNAEKIILRAYGVSPVIYGMDDVNTGMDGASAALQQAVQQFQRTFVEPRQKIVTSKLTMLMNLDGVKVWDCRIKPLNIIDARVDEVQDRQAYMRAVTVDEHRESRLELPPLGGEEGGKLLIAAGSVTAQPNTEQA